MKLKPLADRVLVKGLEPEEVTAGGILLPSSAQEKPQKAEVIAVGPGRCNDEGERIPVDVKEGDIVIHSKYGGSEIKIDGVEYKVLSEKDILAVVE